MLCESCNRYETQSRTPSRDSSNRMLILNNCSCEILQIIFHIYATVLLKAIMETINYFIHFFFLSFNCILLCLDSYKLRICRSTRTKSETTCLPVASRTRFHHDMLGAQMLFTTSLEACEHIGNLLRRQQDSNMCDMNVGWFHVGVDQQVEADYERIKS